MSHKDPNTGWPAIPSPPSKQSRNTAGIGNTDLRSYDQTLACTGKGGTIATMKVYCRRSGSLRTHVWLTPRVPSSENG
ncbi:MAG: hypothetical protein FJY09_00880 [Chlorobi bacterium]|nr:hypothetical protein [Chlorobiota bacterium]